MPYVTELNIHAIYTYPTNIINTLLPTNAIKSDSCIISLRIAFKGSNEEINRKIVIETQKIELYLKDYYLGTTFYITAYEEIQFANPSSIPM